MKKLSSFVLLLLIPFLVSAKGIEKPSDYPDAKNENEYNVEREIIAREELKLYSGPYTEQEIGTVKAGEKHTFKYMLNNRVYLETGKGWMDILKKEYMIQSLDNFIVVNKLKIGCAIVPPNTIIEKPFARDLTNQKLVIDYDGCTGIVSTSDKDIVSMKTNSDFQPYVLLETEYKFYKEANTSSDVLGSIPKRAIIKQIISVEDDNNIKIYTEYKKQKGWLIVQANKTKFFKNEESAIKYRKNSAILNIVLDTMLIIVLGAILIVRSKKRNEKNN